MSKKKHQGTRPLVTRVSRATIRKIDRLAKVCGLSRSEFMAAFTKAGLTLLTQHFEAAP